MFIYNFANDSFQPDFNIQLYRSLKAEIGRRNNFELQSENSTAKLHLYGSIEAFQNKGLMYDSLRTPTRISITAVCKIRLYDVSGAAKNLVFSREFASRIEQSRETGTGDTDKATYVRLSRMLAQQIANGMETEFINMTKQKP